MTNFYATRADTFSYHTDKSPNAKHIPIHGGVAGIIQVPGRGTIIGTIACVARERATGRGVLVSNQHAFFPVVDGVRMPVGTKIYQRGPAGINLVAESYKTIAEKNPWPESKAKQALKQVGIYHDSAIAKAVVPTTNWVNGIGPVTGIATPKKGMRVKMFGGKSGLLRGKILESNSTSVSPVGEGKVSVRKGLIRMDLPTGPGDSGSLIVTDPDNKAVALLFGGAGGTGSVGGSFARVAEVYGLEMGGQTTPSKTTSPPTKLDTSPSLLPPSQENPLLAYAKKHPGYILLGGVALVALIIASR